MLTLSAVKKEKKEKKERKEMDRLIRKYLPDLILELTLLLNAGMVPDNALKEVLLQEHADMLKVKLAPVCQSAEELNRPLSAELYRFAIESGSRELIRSCGLIYDHTLSGADLSAKLERERTMLWNARLSSARGKAGEADTKMTMPLALMLLVLIVICTAPAFMLM